MNFFKTLSIISSLLLIIFLSCFTVANASCCGGFNYASNCPCSSTKDDRTGIILMDPLSPTRIMPQMLDKMVLLLEEAVKFKGSRDQPAGEVRALREIEEGNDKIIWSFPAPSVSKEEVAVSVGDDVLFIKTTKSGFVGTETPYKLPANCGKDEIKAKIEGNKLKITIPKTQRRTIDVEVSSS